MLKYLIVFGLMCALNLSAQKVHIKEILGERATKQNIYIDVSNAEKGDDFTKFNKKNHHRYFANEDFMLVCKLDVFDLKRGKRVNSSVLNEEFKYLKGFFKGFKSKFGNYTLESNCKEGGTGVGCQVYKLKFDKSVNVVEVQEYMGDIEFMYVNFNFPSEALLEVNDRELTAGLRQSDIEADGAGTFWGRDYHSRGFGWHHYSLKTPLAWDISMGQKDIVVAIYDGFDGDLPINDPKLTDLVNRTPFQTNGNWVTMDDNVSNDGTALNSMPISSYDYWGTGGDGHGLVVVSSAIGYANNDNMTSLPLGGHVGTAPNCSAIALKYSGNSAPLTNLVTISQLPFVDVDMTDNTPDVKTRVVAYNKSWTSSLNNNQLDALMDAGIVVIAPAGNGINVNPGLVGDGSVVRPFDNGNSNDPRFNDPNYDVKGISVAALRDGELFDKNCTPWGGANIAPPTNRNGERFNSGWNYSPGTDKFNISTNLNTRIDAKEQAFVDVVAPAAGVATITGMFDADDKKDVIEVSASGTSFAAPYVEGIVGLMSSVNKYFSEPLDADGYPVEGVNVQKKVYDIITFTADKLVDDGLVPAGDASVAQPEYVYQSNDKLRRWWAQRMGFGKVNAYRSLAHSIANKAPYYITSSTALDFKNQNSSGDSRGYVNPENDQLLHMGSIVKEGTVGSYPNGHFWLADEAANPGTTNSELNVLEYGGASIPFISGYHNNTDSDLYNNHEDYNNQGVTVFKSNSRIDLRVNAKQILAIDGMLVSEPEFSGQALSDHRIKTSTSSEEGLIMVEGYLRDVELVGNLRISNLIIDGSDAGAASKSSGIWLGNGGTRSQIYGKVDLLNHAYFYGGGGATTFFPGAELNLLGNNDVKLRFSSEWLMKGGTSIHSDSKKLIIEGGSKVIIEADQKVNLDLEVVVYPCGILEVREDALLKIKKLTVKPGGTFIIKQGAHITFEDQNHDIKGHLDIQGNSSNPIIVRANTAYSCEYEDTQVISTTNVTVCSPNTFHVTGVTVDPSFTETSVNCEVICPTNVDDWFTLSKTKNGNCPNDDDCEITHSFKIPNEYLCRNTFSHYSLKVIINGSTYTNTGIQSYNGQTSFSGINTCITSGSTMSVELKLYKGSSSDPTPCVITKALDCDCDCPAGSDGWLSVAAVKGACGGTSDCLVTNVLDIPTGYPCYTHIEYSAVSGNTTVHNTGAIPLSGFNISNYDNCIVAGSSYTVSINLMKGPFDTNPCTITKEVYCPVDEPSEPCLPDCFDDPFTTHPYLATTIDGCPGCIMAIHYSSRIACDYWQDIQITKIEKFHLPGYPTNSCDACSDTEVYKQAFEFVVSENQMGFSPKFGDTDNCSSSWRVSKASCWATWDKIILNPTDETIRKITVNKPCNSDCCLRRMEVCVNEDGSKTISDLGIISDVSSCENSTYTLPEAPYTVLNCNFTCDMLDDINVVSRPKSTIQEIEDYKVLLEVEGNALTAEINVSNNQGIFRTLIDQSNGSEVKITIYDINGNMKKEISSQVNSGINSYDVDISSYISGTYLYSVVVDGHKMTSGTFYIVK